MLTAAVAAFPALQSGGESCADRHASCAEWAGADECERNPGFMKAECPRACDSCGWGPGMLAPRELWADDAIMNRHDHAHAEGTCAAKPAGPLRWGVELSLGVAICCHNRKGAEPSGSWEGTRFLLDEHERAEVHFTDLATGKLLFVAPRNRSWQAFVDESRHHGWPSFRDAEIVTENVRVLRDGETVSVDGTHLGHNLPDGNGNRYCINLACVSGRALTVSSAN